MTDQVRAISYRPPGRVAQAFHDSTAFVRGLLGPIGSGKSSTCVMEIIKHSMKQKPIRGARRARWAVIRNTYPELKSTTIKTWEHWIGPELATIKWDTPITCQLNIADCGDGVALELEVIFLALDKASETGKLRSLELTGAWLNEASEIPKEVFDVVTSRVGRFPAKRDGGPVHPCVIMDTNAPDDDHWWFKLAEEDRPQGFEFFSQPGGLLKIVNGEAVSYKPNPDAENVFNLPGGYEYYERMVHGKTEDFVKVFILAQYGSTADGKPVFPEYSDKIHYSQKVLEHNPLLPLMLGWDFGLTPACIIGQINPRGQLMVLEEHVAEDMGVRQFAREIIKPLLMNKYGRCRFVSVGDPSGINRSQTDERTVYQELAEAGIASEPAETNDFLPRRESVAFFLTSMAGGEPALLLSANIKTIRKAFLGGYRYERLKVAGERYRDRPVKDKYSHPMDALEYLCLKARQGTSRPRARTIKRVSAKGFV